MSFISQGANSLTSNGAVIFNDDGTNITVTQGATALFRVVKATGQLQVAGDYDAGISL